jgi:hypothetical protein
MSTRYETSIFDPNSPDVRLLTLETIGHAATPSLLALTQGFSEETDYLVWSQILGTLATVKSVFAEDQTVVDGLKKFILKLISPAVKTIGWVSGARSLPLTRKSSTPCDIC